MNSADAQRLEKIKISVNVTNVTLKEAIQTIEQKSNLTFFYDSKSIPLDEKVSLNLNDATVADVLTKLAVDLGLSFSQVDHLIIVKKSPEVEEYPEGNSGTGNNSLQGIIADSISNEPLIGANVFVVGTSLGGATDIDGNYKVTNISDGTYKIRVSYVGYMTKDIVVTFKGNKIKHLDIKLSGKSVEGETIVVTAQASGQLQAINQQIQSTTIKNVVSPERLQQNPDANAAEALGRLPGLSLVRSGGEGTQIIIRGLDAKYSTITLDGVQLPSTDMNNRSTNISGLSLYLLEGVEVYKSITPDMDGNSVAGTVNLTLASAPEGPSFNILAQGGYNDLNKYWGNYAFQLSASNRFFENQLGVKLNLNAERVNRGRRTLGAGYTVAANTTGGLGYESVYLTNASLNNINDIRSKQAATLVLDWQFSKDSKLFFYNFFSSTGADYTSFNKAYDPNNGVINYSADINNDGKNLLYSGILKGEQNLGWGDLDLGVSFSQSHNYTPLDMTFTFSMQNAFNSADRTKSALMQQVDRIINSSLDNSNVSTLNTVKLSTIGYSQNDMLQKDLNLFLNLKAPFKLGRDIAGYLKGGAKYKNTDRYSYSFDASQNVAANPRFVQNAVNYLNWMQVTTNGSYPSAVPFASGNVSNFLDKYNFGWNVNFGRLTDMWNWWNDFSKMVISSNTISEAVGQIPQIGFVPDFYGSSANNQDVIEKYYAAYLMSSLNFGDLVNFIPGVRYEKITDAMIGNYVYDYSSSYTLNFPRTYINANRGSEYFLPNFHLTIKPLDWMHIQAAYTKTVSYPSYNQIMPNTYINNGIAPYSYQTGNPDLKPEQWSSYDLLVAMFTNEIGLFTVDGFYKEVKDYIWTRTYIRIPGDPVLPGFTNNQNVSTTVTVNNDQFVYVKGLEFEWQTNFWYLPKPFNYFSLNINYTVMESKAIYPATRNYTTTEIGNNGKPVSYSHRVDSTVTGHMLYQPNNIANVSLGFNYEGFNMWVSYQFNGDVLTNWNNQSELVGTQSNFQRWDLQLAQKLPIKGLVLRLSAANINNEVQTSNQKGDLRPTYIESYGWTSDFGIMYNF
jgi:TonB-dependent receptor